jgi:hypothetical protein
LPISLVAVDDPELILKGRKGNPRSERDSEHARDSVSGGTAEQVGGM